MEKNSGNIVECYIVRIYRRDAKDVFRVEGSVEGPGGDLVKVFHNAGELLDGLDFPAGNAAGSRNTTKQEVEK